MTYNFEWFNPSLGNPIVSIAEYGLGFNKAAIEALGSPEKVRFGFDKKNKIIAVKSAEDNGDLAFAFAAKEKNRYIRINTKDFVKLIEINIPELNFGKATRYLARYDEEMGVLLVDLKQTTEAETETETGAIDV